MDQNQTNLLVNHLMPMGRKGWRGDAKVESEGLNPGDIVAVQDLARSLHSHVVAVAAARTEQADPSRQAIIRHQPHHEYH